MDNAQKIFSIIRNLGRYYALGTPNLAYRYNGYKKIKKIVEEKLLNISDNRKYEKWHKIINHLNVNLLKYQVKDFSYMQFPALLLSFEIAETNQNFYRFKKSIIISISLLGKYYTSYCAESFTPLIDKNSNHVSNIIYVREIIESLPKDEVQLIRDILSEVLYDYTFVDHSTAFNSKILGTLPYNMNFEEYDVINSKALPIGLFLFGPIEFFNNETKVL